MATRTVEEEKVIPEGTELRARLEKTEDKPIEWTDKTGKARSADIVEWIWKITEPGEFQGETIRGSCDATVSNAEGNRFREWAEALLQRPLDVQQRFDDEDLWGLSAIVKVGHKKGKQGRIFPNVEEVIPLAGDDDDIPF